MLEKTGIPSKEQVQAAKPKTEHQGPVAIMECFQEIPCDPCYAACMRGAIVPFENINHRPRLLPEKCNGCGNCVFACPGLAIFIVDESYSETETLVKIPYEYLPLPIKGDEVIALNREGSPIGKAKVLKVQKSKVMDHTPIIWLTVPKELGMEIRNVKVER
ncbi:MAG: 4Fe-4S binding protein [Bacillota bacterium]